MSDKEKSSHGNQLGFIGALFLVFLTLKLIGKISWSWWWVTAPLWGIPALLLAFAGLVAAVGGLMVLTAHLAERVRSR